jgi:hypothetical protein
MQTHITDYGYEKVYGISEESSFTVRLPLA